MLSTLPQKSLDYNNNIDLLSLKHTTCIIIFPIILNHCPKLSFTEMNKTIIHKNTNLEYLIKYCTQENRIFQTCKFTICAECIHFVLFFSGNLVHDLLILFSSFSTKFTNVQSILVTCYYQLIYTLL